MLTRRAALILLAGATAPGPALGAGPAVVVYKSPSCGCCGGWVTLMRRAGFTAEVRSVNDVSAVLARQGVPETLASCHVSTVAGYAVVGHVPPQDVRALLAEKPKALGIAVPGMPAGSPGMEQPDGRREAFDTLLVLPGGRTRVFRRHA
ncbi:DUF411 domain-containing protein [Phenylobacterium sp.]|jgi:hypothetical protein|uniref:DUF411 domain-containing protein n=1 Tax=Phenylobacterium sp. TaxID=1871053 RepID=UPI002F946F79